MGSMISFSNIKVSPSFLVTCFRTNMPIFMRQHVGGNQKKNKNFPKRELPECAPYLHRNDPWCPLQHHILRLRRTWKMHLKTKQFGDAEKHFVNLPLSACAFDETREICGVSFLLALYPVLGSTEAGRKIELINRKFRATTTP